MRRVSLPTAEIVDNDLEASPRPQRPRRTSFPWIVGLLTVVFGLVGLVIWLMATTVPSDEYQETAALLSDAETGLAEASTQLADLSDENTDLRSELDSLATEKTRLETESADLDARNQQLERGLTRVTDGVMALAVNLLWYDPAYVEELSAGGLDVSVADQVLEDMGIDEPFTSWIEDASWIDVSRLSTSVSDDGVEEGWNAFLIAEIDSVEEEAAYVEFDWRLARFLLETLNELEE